MSIQAVAWAIRQRTGSPRAKLVLIAAANYADEDGICWPSQQRLADDTEMTPRTVRAALADLEAAGILSRDERRRPDGGRTSDVIKLHISAACDDTPRKNIPHPPEKYSGAPRKSDPHPPEKFSGQEPSMNHQKNHTAARQPVAANDERFEEFWEAYPSRGQSQNPKKPARDKFAKAVKAGADPQVIIAAAHRYTAAAKKDGIFGTGKVAQAQTWLNQERWDDGASDQPAACPGGDEERWAGLLRSHAQGIWSDHWGPPPGQPGCRIPTEFITRWRGEAA